MFRLPLPPPHAFTCLSPTHTLSPISREQYLHSCGRSSPIWRPTKSAMLCQCRPHTAQLATPRQTHPGHMPSRQVCFYNVCQLPVWMWWCCCHVRWRPLSHPLPRLTWPQSMSASWLRPRNTLTVHSENLSGSSAQVRSRRRGEEVFFLYEIKIVKSNEVLFQ